MLFFIEVENHKERKGFRAREGKPYAGHLPDRGKDEGEEDDGKGSSNQRSEEGRLRVIRCGEIGYQKGIDSDKEESPEVKVNALCGILVQTCILFTVK